jgi:hypothetical protein
MADQSLRFNNVREKPVLEFEMLATGLKSDRLKFYQGRAVNEFGVSWNEKLPQPEAQATKAEGEFFDSLQSGVTIKEDVS